MVEVHPVVPVTALAFATLVVLRFGLTARAKLAWFLALVTMAVVFAIGDVPVILAWITTCLVKTVRSSQWLLASLVSVTALLPMTTSVGTPTYTTFTILVCCFVTAIDARTFEDKLRFLDYKYVVPTLATAVLLLILLLGNVRRRCGRMQRSRKDRRLVHSASK